MSEVPETPGSDAGRPSLSRRTFLRRMAVLGFAVPIVASFTLDAAYASSTGADDQTGADRDAFFGNQTSPNLFSAEEHQFYGNQYFGNQGGESDFEFLRFPNQYLPNQFPSPSNT
ncbi:MAG: hypothetical protein ACP5O0_01810 [Acidimicrobiales bacterium]